MIGTFHSWNLFQPEENASGNPKWTLQAVFSFQKDSMLLNEHLDKRITLILNKDTKIELCDYEEIEITGVNLTIKGVVQCQ